MGVGLERWSESGKGCCQAVQPKYFTAKRAKTAKAYSISEQSGDPTVQNFPDPTLGFSLSRVGNTGGFSACFASSAVQMQCLGSVGVGMEPAEDRVVQLVPAHLEVHLGAIDGVSLEVEEAADCRKANG